MNVNDKKKRAALGMHVSVANRRLQKDLLYKFVTLSGHNQCFRCGNPMSRDDFTMDHKKDWLNSGTPQQLYFDVENVAFSHHSCNSGAQIRSTFSDEQRLEARRISKREYMRRTRGISDNGLHGELAPL